MSTRFRLTGPLTLTLLLAACGQKDPLPPVDTSDSAVQVDDADGDWYSVEAGDCDDNDPLVFPGAAEVCDGLDNNCNGQTDEGYTDQTGDGIPDCPGDEECDGVDNDLDGEVDEFLSDVDGDGTCDGLDEEICDGVDNDGDGEVDEGIDFDGDGTPDCTENEPCDGVDNDGDGQVDELSDMDRDGYQACGASLDCDDQDPATHPGAAEICGDGQDNDCDGVLTYCSPLGAISLADAPLRVLGDDMFEDRLGSALALGPDVRPEAPYHLVLGAAGDTWGGVNAGAVFLVPADATGMDLASDLASAWYTGTNDERFGVSVSVAGDLDADGYAEVLVGAPGNKQAGAGAGGAWVVWGGGETTDRNAVASVGALLSGVSAGDAAGTSVAGVGDVNGDGSPDVMVGAPGADSTVEGGGLAYLLAGPITGALSVSSAMATLQGSYASDAAGTTVAGVGDVNGDGIPDVAVGAPYDNNIWNDTKEDYGSVFLFYGPVSGTVSVETYDFRFYGSTASGYLGRSISQAGDYDGDGHLDVLLGQAGAGISSWYGNEGCAWLHEGPFTSTYVGASAGAVTFCSSVVSRGMGATTAGGGDVNRDGFDDVLVGSAEGEAVYLFLGPTEGARGTAADAVYTVPGAGALANPGLDLSLDVTGDGAAEILIGGGSDATGGYASGTAWLLPGGPGY